MKINDIEFGVGLSNEAVKVSGRLLANVQERSQSALVTTDH
tara:strand:+ start:619 stop:741 length:123 start_codon:yes stop_codon:yes gene_type:complete